MSCYGAAVIRNVVMVKLRPDSDPALVAEIQGVFRTLNCPGTVSFTVGDDLGLRDGNWSFAIVSDFTDAEAEFALMRQMVRKSGRPLSFSLLQGHVAPDKWRLLLDRTAEANAEGLTIRAQVAGRPVGVLLGLEPHRAAFPLSPSGSFFHFSFPLLPVSHSSAQTKRQTKNAPPKRCVFIARDDLTISLRTEPAWCLQQLQYR